MNINHWRRVLLCLAAVTALVATACGNADEKAAEAARDVSTSTTATPATVPQTVEGDCVEGAECIEADDEPEIVEAPRVTTPEFVAFAAAADKICLATAPKIAALSDRDGEGGQKQTGIGVVVEQWGEELGALEAPAEIAIQWAEATGLLAGSGRTLTEAEELAAAGDAEGSENAQNQALFELQPKAAEIASGLGVPFQGCFKE